MIENLEHILEYRLQQAENFFNKIKEYLEKKSSKGLSCFANREMLDKQKFGPRQGPAAQRLNATPRAWGRRRRGKTYCLPDRQGLTANRTKNED